MPLSVINGIADVPLRDMIGEIWGFLAILLIARLIMVLVPETVLWLPWPFGYQG